MRIAHVSDCYLPRLGGIERQVHDLALRQLGAGDEVVVFTSAPGGRVPGSTTDEAAVVDDVPVVAPRAFRAGSPGTIRYAKSLRVRRAVLAREFDVVHVHASTFSPLAFLTAAATSRAGVPTALTVHSLMAGWAPAFRAANRITGWARWPVAWSAVSTVAAEPVKRILGPHTPVAVLPNGVDPGEWQVHRGTPEPGRVVIATVGRLAGRKRPLALLAMLKQVRSRLPEEVKLEAVLVGEGPLRPRIEAFMRRNRMQDWVSLTGAATRDQILDLYMEADMYVAPASLESFGIAALEARCAGLPVIAHSGSGVADFIRHGVDGFLTRDDDEMVDSIVNLCLSPALREHLSVGSRARLATVDWPSVLRATYELYDRARVVAGSSDRIAAPFQLV